MIIVSHTSKYAIWQGVGGWCRKGILKNIVTCDIKRQKLLKRTMINKKKKYEFLQYRMDNCSWSILNMHYVPGTQLVSKKC